MASDMRMVDAVNRIELPGRTVHDLTNYPIEAVRFLIKTWENSHGGWITSFITKLVAFSIALPWLLLVACILF